jgi:hypothetical protein
MPASRQFSADFRTRAAGAADDRYFHAVVSMVVTDGNQIAIAIS